MLKQPITTFAVAVAAAFLTGGCVHNGQGAERRVGPFAVRTLQLPAGLKAVTATYTPNGRVLLRYTDVSGGDARHVRLATMNDDGSDFRPFFAQTLPLREQDNGIRFMIFPDNRRIFLGDFVIECAASIDACERPSLLPVVYPDPITKGKLLSHRWSEMIVAPDNRHIAWTALLADYSAIMATGTLERGGSRYRIADARIVSTLERFQHDPEHADGVIPMPVRNGEVKQFVRGGTGISVASAKDRDTTDSVVVQLNTGAIDQITHNPGYDETTIFSPDETLGIVMTTRFSAPTDMAILGLIPRPYPAALNMGLSSYMYSHGVVGVRQSRIGNVGPALIDIAASMTEPGYMGDNLATDPQWVFRSPISWHPGGQKALWPEGRRGSDDRRIRIVDLPSYRPGPTATPQTTPTAPWGASDLNAVKTFMQTGRTIDVKVYGRSSGHLRYHKTAGGMIEKTYFAYSDDGQATFNGKETMAANPRDTSVYIADLTVSGRQPGSMKLRMTFGPLTGETPARLIFARGSDGQPASHGFAEYGGKRLTVDQLVP